MFGMSNDQIMGMIRQFLPFLGGMATALGFLTASQVEGLTATILQLAGPAVTLASVLWSLISKTQASIVASAAAIPNVKSIVLDGTVAGTAAIDRATPPNVTVVR